MGQVAWSKADGGINEISRLSVDRTRNRGSQWERIRDVVTRNMDVAEVVENSAKYSVVVT